MDTNAITLYGCWRSSCSHRLQIALRLKQLRFRYRPVSLDDQEQREPWFVALNPLAQVPVLQVGEEIWADSLVALETLEERFPAQGERLLPADPVQRQQVRRVVSAIGSRLQPGLLPLQMREHIPLPESALSTLRLGLQTAALEGLERLIRGTAGLYCIGDRVSLADLLFVAHLSAAERMGMSTGRYPLLCLIQTRCLQLEAFAASRPEQLPDAPAAAQRHRRDSAIQGTGIGAARLPAPKRQCTDPRPGCHPGAQRSRLRRCGLQGHSPGGVPVAPLAGGEQGLPPGARDRGVHR